MLIPSIYKYLISAGLAIAYSAIMVFCGYTYSENSHQIKDLKRENAEVVVAKETTDKVVDSIQKTEVKVEQAKEKVRVVYKYVDREVIKYAKADPVAADTSIADPEWVRLFNSSSLACDPSDANCVKRSEVDGKVTREEALFVAKEQHQLYQSCRVTVEGLRGFYEGVRKAYNGDSK